MAHQPESRHEYLLRRPGDSRGQRRHAHAHHPREHRDLWRQALGQAQQLLPGHPLERPVRPHAERPIADLDSLDLAANGFHLEDRRVAGHARKAGPLVGSRQLGARADQRDQGPPLHLARPERSGVTRSG